MYTTPEETMESTGYDGITVDQIRQAQFIIEIYTGRTESQVDGARDKALLARATSAQAIYMRGNPDISFDQIKVSSRTGGDGAVAYNDNYSPFVAPLAAMACDSLSWFNSRSIKTGKSFQPTRRRVWETE